MIEVHAGLFVGKNEDFISIAGNLDRWAVVHSAKEPYHREFVGYTGKGAPPSSEEYLFARRHWRLALNLVDVIYSEYVKPALVDEAMRFIDEARDEGRKILIHCNQGGSRAPSLALHWLRRNDPRFVSTADDITPLTFGVGEAIMRAIYPAYAPAEGVRGYVRDHWND